MSLTTIQATDKLKNSRAVINSNFTDLEGRMVENTGDETIAGVKTFTGDVIVGDTLIDQSTGNITPGGVIAIQDEQDGGPGKGIAMWSAVNDDRGIYMGQAGAGKSFDGGTACGSLSGETGHHIRTRTGPSGANGFLRENSSEACLMSLESDTGNLYTLGTINDQVISDSGWITPTLVNSRVDFGSPVASVQYKLIGNTLKIKGLVKNGTSGTVFNLPVGYRPAGDRYLSSIKNGNLFLGLLIAPTGSVIFVGTFSTTRSSVECSLEL